MKKNYLNSNDSDIFNVGYGHGFSVLEVIDTAKKISGVDFEVIDAPRRLGDPAVLIADSSKLRNLTSWKPKKDNLETIIASALAWEKKI